jgi:hypothetical protein
MLTLRRSGRVAEGGALLRRYVGEYLHRGFESLLLRQPRKIRPRLRRVRRFSGDGIPKFGRREPRPSCRSGRRIASLSGLARRGGRAVECGGLENRYPSLGGSRVQIPPPPLPEPKPMRVIELGLRRRCPRLNCKVHRDQVDLLGVDSAVRVEPFYGAPRSIRPTGRARSCAHAREVRVCVVT